MAYQQVVFVAATVAGAVGQFLDAHSTQAALKLGLKEGNGLIAPITKIPALFYALKLGLPIGIGIAVLALAHGAVDISAGDMLGAAFVELACGIVGYVCYKNNTKAIAAHAASVAAAVKVAPAAVVKK